MNNLAEKLESIFEVESVGLEQFDIEIVEFSPENRESLSENFLAEIDAWAGIRGQYTYFHLTVGSLEDQILPPLIPQD